MTYGSGGYVDTAVAVADMNQDGTPDLVVANTCADKLCGGEGLVGVLFGNGDGTFQAAVIYGSGGRFAQSVAVADVNGDGRLDILAANESGSIGALVGNGDGTFQPAVANEAIGSHRFIVVADVNGDGSPDIVVLVTPRIPSMCCWERGRNVPCAGSSDTVDSMLRPSPLPM